MKKSFAAGALIGTILLCAISCGHLSNPAPPKAELTADRDQISSCEDMTAEIMDLQTQQVNVQKQIDTQRTQNILSRSRRILHHRAVCLHRPDHQQERLKVQL